MWQSCAHARIECGNPVPTPGLTVGRVNGEKNTPEAMLRGQHRFRTFGAGPVMGFSGKKAKSEFRPWCGAGSAGWRLLCRAGGAAGVADDDPPCWEPSRKRGWASQYSLGEPVLRGRWASQRRSTLGELASNRAGRASIEDWASIKHGCSYWRLLSAAPLAQWTRASATCSVAPNLAPPHLLSGRGRLPLVQWLPISHRPTCSVDAGVCHLLSGTKFAPAPLVQWMLASPTCSVAPSRPPHELTAALPGRSASRR